MTTIRFFLVVKHTSIQMLLAIVIQFDLELEQMDVKTAFLHGELEEKIYMKQPEGYIQEDKDNKVYLCTRRKKEIEGVRCKISLNQMKSYNKTVFLPVTREGGC